ncbi:MAG TPA: Uma2 family endonuclease [Planctomycetota bacterium]|nr:Uma2 family endonuclease [Planctomycetota bacterium]
MRTDIKFTYREYRALPETGPRYQLIEGELVLSPSPNFKHQSILMYLGGELYRFAKDRKLGTVCAAPLDVILSDEDVCQPDIFFIAAARKHIISSEGVRGAPDLCIEILSPSNRDLDLETKRVIYARYGVTEYWIVDPDADTILVYHLQDNPREPFKTLRGGDALSSLLLPDFTLAVSAVFAEA